MHAVTKGHMADYFTNFSLVFTLPSQEAQAYALELAAQASRIQQGDEKPEGFPEELAEHVEDWCFETSEDTAEKKPALWLHSSNGGIDAACAFISHLLEKFDPTGCVTFEWSHDCSKPRTDAYGGGAAIITATEIKTMSTCEWLTQNTPREAVVKALAELTTEQHLFSRDTNRCLRCDRRADDDAVEPQPCRTPHAS